MKKEKNIIRIALLYVRKNSWQFYADNLTSPVSVDIPTSIINDLEVKDVIGLDSTTRDFVFKNSLSPAFLLIILADNICYLKEFPNEECDQKTEDIRKICAAIPFDAEQQKVFMEGKSCKLVVVNQNLYESIQEAFDKTDIKTLAVVPAGVLEIKVPASGLTTEVSQKILSRLDEIRQKSLPGNFATIEKEQLEGKIGKINRKVIILLVVFFILLITLAGTLSVSMQGTKYQPPPPKDIVKPSLPSVTSTASASLLASPSALFSPEKYTVNILNGSAIPGLGGNLRKQLLALGFKDVAVGNAPVLGDKTIIIYSTKIPPQILDKIMTLLKEDFNEVVAQAGLGLDWDLVITTGKRKIAP